MLFSVNSYLYCWVFCKSRSIFIFSLQFQQIDDISIVVLNPVTCAVFNSFFISVLPFDILWSRGWDRIHRFHPATFVVPVSKPRHLFPSAYFVIFLFKSCIWEVVRFVYIGANVDHHSWSFIFVITCPNVLHKQEMLIQNHNSGDFCLIYLIWYLHLHIRDMMILYVYWLLI